MNFDKDFFRVQARAREARTVARRMARMNSSEFITRNFGDLPNLQLRTISDLSTDNRQSYSYARLLKHLATEPHLRQGCLESDIDLALAAELGGRPGIGADEAFVPLSLRSGLDSKSGSVGGYLAGTAVGELITLLRQKTLVLQLGAQLLQLPRSTSLPVQTSGSTATWASENPGSDVSQTDMAFGQKSLTPHSLTCTTGFSMKLLLQSDSTCEAIVRDDLSRSISVALDAAAINGSGTQNQPVGILQTTGIGDVPGGTNGLIPTFANIVSLEDKLGASHADIGSLSYVTTSAMRTKLKQVEEVSGSGVALWRPAPWAAGQGMMNGYRAEATNAVPSDLVKGNANTCHAVIFANWNDLLLAQFGVMALVVDRFALKKRGGVEVTAYIDADVLVRRPESFAAMKDGLIS
jgi:HK97 family phage major capsid protein